MQGERSANEERNQESGECSAEVAIATLCVYPRQNQIVGDKPQRYNPVKKDSNGFATMSGNVWKVLSHIRERQCANKTQNSKLSVRLVFAREHYDRSNL